jgi:hypothetical protein
MISGRIESAREWFVETPQVLRMVDAQVLSVSESLEARTLAEEESVVSQTNRFVHEELAAQGAISKTLSEDQFDEDFQQIHGPLQNISDRCWS